MMKKISRRSFLQVCGITAATAALTACGSGKAEGDKSSSQNGKIQITFYLWDRSMMKALTPWLEEKFPEYEFNFIQGFNTMDYYRDLLNRAEQLPDIITCRRFSLNDAAPLAEHLMDLSTTEVAGTFYSSYLNNNQEPDGAIRWLPMCAEVDGTAANVDLFAQHNIPLPTNYAEFVAAIDAFEAIGIKGYQADWRYDYTCLETMQGSAIPELMSLEGTTWRMNYESETEDGSTGLDDVVWPKVFEKYEQFLKDVRVQPGDDRLELNPIAKPFYARQTAMIRTTAGIADVMPDQYGFNASILPYFGETANDSWLLTYPMCQAAVSNTVAQDEAKLAAVLKVLEAVYSAEGQSKMAGGAAVLSYNKEINITSSTSLEQVADIISANHLYMRLASTEIFRISEDVGHKMITGEYNAKAAYDAFNEQLVTPRADPEAEVLFTQNTAYSIDMTDHGSAAASSLMNALRATYDASIAVGYSPLVSTSIYCGEYSKQQILWVMAGNYAVSQGEYTGAELRQMMEWLVNVKDNGANPIRHRNYMPVTSGMEYKVTEYEQGKFRLEELTINGAPLDDTATYTVFVAGTDVWIENEVYCNCPMPENLKAKRTEYAIEGAESRSCLKDSLAVSKQFPAPSEYLTIVQGE